MGAGVRLIFHSAFRPARRGDWFLISRSNVATRDNLGDTFLAYTGASLGYQITARWSLRFGYPRAWFRFGEDWQPEHRAMLEGFVGDTIEGFQLSDRLRGESRYFDWRVDDIRLRNETGRAGD